MWLEAILSRQDLERVLGELTPTTIKLGEDGELHLNRPTLVTLVEGQGLEVDCPAKLRWSVLGIHLPVAIESVTLRLIPSVLQRDGGDVLAFHVKLLALDVSAMPSIIEDRVVALVNGELSGRHAELVWDFRETLSHRFRLPELLEPARSLDVEIAWGEMRVSAEALVFAISVHVRALVDPPTAIVAVPQAPPRRAPPVRLSPTAVAIGGAALALSISLLGFALGEAIARRRHSHALLSLWKAFA